MKYMQSGGFQHNPLMRLTLQLTALFLLGLWITNGAMYFSRMGLTPDSVAAYYLGSEADFTSPRSPASMLEVTHAHLPIMAIVVLLLTHLLIFAPMKDSAKRALIYTAFLSALLSEGSGWLVRFVHPGFAWLKIASFLAFQGILAFMLVSLSLFLIAGSHERKRAK